MIDLFRRPALAWACALLAALPLLLAASSYPVQTVGLPDMRGQSGKVLSNNGLVSQWVASSGGGVTTMGAFGSTPAAEGASISSTTLTMQPADGTHPGAISLAAQTMGAGRKTFTTSTSGVTEATFSSTAGSDARGGFSLNATGAAGAGVVQLSSADGALEVYTISTDKVCLGTNNSSSDMCIDSSHNVLTTTPGTDAITAGFAFRKNTTTATTAPSAVLQINRENSATAALRIGVDGNDDAVIGGNGAINLRFGTYAGSIFTERVTFKSDGTVKTTADLASTTSGNGLILKDSGGTCYRYTPTLGTGVLSIATVTCP